MLIFLSWRRLIEDNDLPDKLRQAISARANQALTNYHTLAYMLCPRNETYPQLPSAMYDEARNYLAENYPAHIAYMAAFEVQDTTLYPKSLFNSELRRVLTPTKYWQWARKVCTLKEAKDFCDFMENLYTCPASSAGLERIFSSFGLVHTKLRNRLSKERVIKLVKVYCTLRGEGGESPDLDNFIFDD